DEQIWQLIAYIRTLAGATTTSSAAASMTGGNTASGEALFFGKAACGSCHEVNGRGGVVGPDLSALGRLSGAALRQQILDPNNRAAAVPGGRTRGGGRGGAGPPTSLVVEMRDGGEFRGVRPTEDPLSPQMLD